MENAEPTTTEGKTLEIRFPDSFWRDYFAAKALVRLIEDHAYQPDENGVHNVYLPNSNGSEEQHDKMAATRSYEIADAMLAERSKRQ